MNNKKSIIMNLTTNIPVLKITGSIDKITNVSTFKNKLRFFIQSYDCVFKGTDKKLWVSLSSDQPVMLSDFKCVEPFIRYKQMSISILQMCVLYERFDVIDTFYANILEYAAYDRYRLLSKNDEDDIDDNEQCFWKFISSFYYSKKCTNVSYSILSLYFYVNQTCYELELIKKILRVLSHDSKLMIESFNIIYKSYLSALNNNDSFYLHVLKTSKIGIKYCSNQFYKVIKDMYNTKKNINTRSLTINTDSDYVDNYRFIRMYLLDIESVQFELDRVQYKYTPIQFNLYDKFTKSCFDRMKRYPLDVKKHINGLIIRYKPTYLKTWKKHFHKVYESLLIPKSMHFSKMVHNRGVTRDLSRYDVIKKPIINNDVVRYDRNYIIYNSRKIGEKYYFQHNNHSTVITKDELFKHEWFVYLHKGVRSVIPSIPHVKSLRFNFTDLPKFTGVDRLLNKSDKHFHKYLNSVGARCHYFKSNGLFISSYMFLDSCQFDSDEFELFLSNSDTSIYKSRFYKYARYPSCKTPIRIPRTYLYYIKMNHLNLLHLFSPCLFEFKKLEMKRFLNLLSEKYIAVSDTKYDKDILGSVSQYLVDYVYEYELNEKRLNFLFTSSSLNNFWKHMNRYASSIKDYCIELHDQVKCILLFKKYEFDQNSLIYILSMYEYSHGWGILLKLINIFRMTASRIEHVEDPTLNQHVGNLLVHPSMPKNVRRILTYHATLFTIETPTMICDLSLYDLPDIRIDIERHEDVFSNEVIIYNRYDKLFYCDDGVDDIHCLDSCVDSIFRIKNEEGIGISVYKTILDDIWTYCKKEGLFVRSVDNTGYEIAHQPSLIDFNLDPNVDGVNMPVIAKRIASYVNYIVFCMTKGVLLPDKLSDDMWQFIFTNVNATPFINRMNYVKSQLVGTLDEICDSFDVSVDERKMYNIHTIQDFVKVYYLPQRLIYLQHEIRINLPLSMTFLWTPFIPYNDIFVRDSADVITYDTFLSVFEFYSGIYDTDDDEVFDEYEDDELNMYLQTTNFRATESAFLYFVKSLSDEDRAKLNHFITGSYLLPDISMNDRKIKIEWGGSTCNLPMASNCLNILRMPINVDQNTDFKQLFRHIFENEIVFGFE